MDKVVEWLFTTATKRPFTVLLFLTSIASLLVSVAFTLTWSPSSPWRPEGWNTIGLRQYAAYALTLLFFSILALLSRYETADRGGVPLKMRDSRRVRIEGKYHADGNPTYVVEITHISGDLYAVEHVTWRGAALFDGANYLGVWCYGDNAYPDWLRRHRGAHVGTYHPEDESIRFNLIDLSEDRPTKEPGVWKLARE